MENGYLSIIRKLLNEMNDKIQYCHWKSNQHFSDALVGIDDLDILINREQYPEMIKILSDLSFKRFIIPPARTYIGIEDYLGFDEETGAIVHLHLHHQLVVGENHLKGFLLPIEKEILEKRVWDKEHEVYYSSPYDELLLLILRTAMKNRKRDFIRKNVIDSKTRDEFLWLKSKCDGFDKYLEEKEWLTGRIRHIVKQIFENEFSYHECRKLMHYLYHDLSFYSQGGEIHNTIKRNWREGIRVILEIKKRYLNSKYMLLRRRSATGGLVVAFLGSDGAGKSTAVAATRKWLFKVMDVRYFYLGSGDGNSSLLRMPLKFAAYLGQKIGVIKKANNFNREDLKEDDTASKKMGFAKKLWAYTLSIERIKKLKSVYRCRQYGFVVLTDRYPQNEFPGLCDGRRLLNEKGRAAKTEEKAFHLAKLCPPDLVIKLIVSPEEAMRRKPGEVTYTTTKNLTERVKALSFSDRTRIVEIDADQQQDMVLLCIKKEIWKSI